MIFYGRGTKHQMVLAQNVPCMHVLEVMILSPRVTVFLAISYLSDIEIFSTVEPPLTATSPQRPCFPVPTSDPFTQILLLKTYP